MHVLTLIDSHVMIVDLCDAHAHKELCRIRCMQAWHLCIFASLHLCISASLHLCTSATLSLSLSPGPFFHFKCPDCQSEAG